MSTRAPALRAAWLLHLLALGAVLCPPRATAITQVDAQTEVASIRFQGLLSLNRNRVQSVLQTRDRGGAYGLRVALGRLPFVPGPTRHPFSPLTLQEDVVRIRRAYSAAGFFRSHVYYTVRRDDARNLLDITFIVDEGQPAVFTEVKIVPRDTMTTLPIPPGEQRSWRAIERSVIGQRGHRVNVDEARRSRERLTNWWRNRGYPLASVTPRVNADSARTQAQITYRVAAGAFARFGPVSVIGNRSIDERVDRKSGGWGSRCG